MKKYIFFLLSLCLVILSCQKDEEPFLIINQTDITITDAGGSKSITFEVNVNWTAKSSENWCTVNPSSGDASTNVTTINISKNSNHDVRSCNLILTAGNLSKTITITQSAKSGLLVTQDKYELANDASTIEVEVKANVEYEVTISDEWITKADTRGLTSTKLKFNIAENISYGNREGSITFKENGGNLSSIIKVYQSQQDAIILSKKIENLTSDSQTLEVELKTNVDFEVIIPELAKKWVSYTGTRALKTETLLLNIASNENYDARSTEIYVKNIATNLQDTLTINQSQLDALILSSKTENLTSDSQTLNVELKTNVDCEVIIPEDTKKWVSYTSTRAIRTENFSLCIAANKSDAARSTEIYFKNKLLTIQDTLTLTQYAQCTYFAKKMGTLGSILSQTQKDTITTMIVMGEINSADFRVMKSQMPKLRYLDLKDVTCEEDEIPYGAFGGQENSNITINTIILPLSITNIEACAFWGCTGLTGVLELPTKLKTIGTSAFSDCTGLSGSLILPTGLTKIGHYAFMDCVGFTGSLSLPAGLNTIESRAFYDCSGFTGTLTLPAGLTKIGPFAFRGCSGFTGSLSIPLGVTTVGTCAFSGCYGFNGSLSLPEGLTTIESATFSECSGFTGCLALPKGLKLVQGNAFTYCTGFTSLTFSVGLTTIEGYAFLGCTGFTGALNLPAGLETIGDRAFMDCSGFSRLNLPDGLKTIEESAFRFCFGLSGHLILPAGLTTIENSAFIGCRGLTGTLTFPPELTTVGHNAFTSCSGFTKLELSEGLTTLEEFAFSYCKGLTGSLTLPAGLTTIEAGAFYDCSGLKSLTFGNNLVTINNDAFCGCINITGNVIFPISLDSIKNDAFKGCYYVNAFRFPHTFPLAYYPNVFPIGATVEVPTSAVVTYKETNGWKSYNIVGY